MTSEKDAPLHWDGPSSGKTQVPFLENCFHAFILLRYEQLYYDAQGQNFNTSLNKIRLTWADNDSAKAMTKRHE